MALNSDAQKYGVGSDASIGATQFNDFYWQKKALIEATKEQYFQQMADVTSMPKNMGKKIKRYHYLPLLDDANINDQGIDANGLVVNQRVSIAVTHVDGEVPDINSEGTQRATGNKVYFIGEGITAAAAADAAIASLLTWARTATVGGGLGLALVGANDTDLATTVTTGGLSAYDLGYRFSTSDGVTIVDSSLLDATSVNESGNLYGSSKDIGFIAGKFPTLTETGGRVNRVGHKRIELEGTFAKYGFFDEYTQESLDFDTDSELRMHINREMIKAANEMTEDKLQIDLLNSAGIVRYTGNATSKATMHGETGACVPTYNDLMRLSIELDETRTPKSTKMITGSRMVDTKTVQGARYMFIGSELEPTVRKMTDISASGVGSGFVSVEQYGAAGANIARGEIGQVGQFKFIVVPEMMNWAGQGAAEGTNTGYRQTGGNYDVFPMLVVGSESFTTIGFQTDGKSTKFSIKHVKPGSTQSYNFDDPYGELGFMSIKWHYGFMVLRPERIALMYSVAEW